jgi:hypothetical protein
METLVNEPRKPSRLMRPPTTASAKRISHRERIRPISRSVSWTPTAWGGHSAPAQSSSDESQTRASGSSLAVWMGVVALRLIGSALHPVTRFHDKPLRAWPHEATLATPTDTVSDHDPHHGASTDAPLAPAVHRRYPVAGSIGSSAMTPAVLSPRASPLGSARVRTTHVQMQIRNPYSPHQQVDCPSG